MIPTGPEISPNIKLREPRPGALERPRFRARVPGSPERPDVASGKRNLALIIYDRGVEFRAAVRVSQRILNTRPAARRGAVRTWIARYLYGATYAERVL
jgi:hypothetical protein